MAQLSTLSKEMKDRIQHYTRSRLQSAHRDFVEGERPAINTDALGNAEREQFRCVLGVANVEVSDIRVMPSSRYAFLPQEQEEGFDIVWTKVPNMLQARSHAN